MCIYIYIYTHTRFFLTRKLRLIPNVRILQSLHQQKFFLIWIPNKQTSKQANIQTSKQASKQANKQHKQTNEQTNKQTNKQTHKHTKQTNKQANKHTHTHIYIYIYIYIYIFLYIYIYTENYIIQAPVFGGSHIYVLCSFVSLCPYLALLALFVDTTCSISRVGWAEIGSLSKSFVSCLFLLAQSSYWVQCFRRRAPPALELGGGGGGPKKKKKIKPPPPLPQFFFFLAHPPPPPFAGITELLEESAPLRPLQGPGAVRGVA